MPTTVRSRLVGDVEDFLLSLVARAEGRSVVDLREEEDRFPDDPPWDSEQFVRYMFEIEEHFGVDFDPIEVERHSRTLRKLAVHILDLLASKQAQVI
jgi:acyl carrier protein